jgi:predicted metal-dependent phosphoesterase TrpH
MSPAQIVKLAKLSGLECISITDHDSMGGVEEATKTGEALGITVVPGVELSCYNPENGRKVHILGYNIKDQQGLKLIEEKCRPYLNQRHEGSVEAVKKIHDAGSPRDLDDALEYVGPSGVLYRQHIIHSLFERCYSPSIYGEFYKKLFGFGAFAYVSYSYMTAEEGVKLIKEAGGQAALAHPFHYNSYDIIPDLASWGLDGLECWHHSQTPDRIEAVKEAAEKHGLFLTGGSDWHGLYSIAQKPMGWLNITLPEDHELFLLS